ncbi:winged helix-turn-helix transcriptional regulator [Clostridium botulinum]|uniref:ArsR/SmtB family transcription factor n=1 Tax=Clostridium botulinum TaxID=1491 RepID=UPI0007737C7B|nr:metalloregulator ArsR/SmtB family transcription factor [Clostridium botulinum]APH19726.1 bacterial regulatory, arsR family protein [Clostridium botulinum]AUM90616.1 transcriptional regulator [Clostridium botulinum]NFB14106.1 ArsR family transcriptional regulator [Clostridium botulinum]NFH56792.1 winged helix-turn-helix transcriptional regulator [Clostridium botulinum]NFH60808.1 winged helix-turn-helix transcriptional regulator [Clostridium botulinum]
MTGTPQISQLAEILADKSRATILMVMMDGEFHTVNELARAAGIKSHTASYHLTKLTELQWIVMEKHGRFHYYQISNKELAQMLESWLQISPLKPSRSLNQSIENQMLYFGRVCYDHLAGKIGVQITDWLLEKNYIVKSEAGWSLSIEGENFFESNGVNIELLKKEKRCYCRMCLDWSERKHHVAGSVGKALMDIFFNNQWIERTGDSRAIKLTTKGKEQLSKKWDIDFESENKLSE